MLGIEIHREYNNKFRELLDAYDEAFAEQQKFLEGRKAGRPVSKQDFEVMRTVWETLGKVLQHMEGAPEVVRSYRIVDTNDNNRIVADFREEAASAESEAKKIAMSKYLHKYDVLEEQEDGTWLSIWTR